MNVRRALISVYDKTGIVEFARSLHDEFGVEIISTGGTAKLLKDNGIPVTLVEDITGFPEMLDGRVKTLHPKIFAGILADRDNPEHMRQLEAMGIKPIDMVVVNLYPFEKTVADPNCTFEQAIEMIDIGGVALLRAAAKNHKYVLVPACAEDFAALVTWIRGNELSEYGWQRVRRDYAHLAFMETSRYDAAISTWLSARNAPDHKPLFRFLHMWDRVPLRYAENPHQPGEVLHYGQGQHRFGLTTAEGSDSKAHQPLSYNNYLDADAALRICAELSRAVTTRLTAWKGGPSSPETPHDISPNTPHGISQDTPHGISQDTPHDISQDTPHGIGGPAFQPVISGASPRISEERHSRRHLPHIEKPGATYWLTFRLLSGELSLQERQVVFDAIRFWHTKTMTLHACVVMPDHIHMIATPHEAEPGQWVSLGELLQSIKGFSSREINKLRGRKGPLWMDETWDEIIRNEKSYLAFLNYILENPPRKGLEKAYPWMWFNEHPWRDLAEHDQPWKQAGIDRRIDRLESDRLKSRSPGFSPQSEPGQANFTKAVSVFIKHNNACGVGVAGTAIEAYHRSYLSDPNAAMGGVLAVNFEVNAEFAATVMQTFDHLGKPLRETGASNAPSGFFLEAWVAPNFTDDAVKIIRGTAEASESLPIPPKKPWGERTRLFAVGDMNVAPDPSALEYRSISGGMLVQTQDLVGLNEDQWRVATKRAPTEAEMADLRLAWLIAKHTKSNAISIVRDGQLIGNGAGQMSRVMSCRIAVWLARENGHFQSRDRKGAGSDAEAQRHEGTEAQRQGETKARSEMNSARTEGRGSSEALPHGRSLVTPVAASDAFFPFRDGPDILMDAGVTAIIQPGGSKRDAEVIAACNERGVAMIFTGTRHFRH